MSFLIMLYMHYSRTSVATVQTRRPASSLQKKIRKKVDFHVLLDKTNLTR